MRFAIFCLRQRHAEGEQLFRFQPRILCEQKSEAFHHQAGTDQEHQSKRHFGDNEHRSEEHTSELQSLRHLVCRLLLEKKKHNKTHTAPKTGSPGHLELMLLVGSSCCTYGSGGCLGGVVGKWTSERGCERSFYGPAHVL